jgi:thiol-disulfide isomerase/thioredoxin
LINALTIVLAVAAAAQTLTSIDGSAIDIGNQRGKVVVLAVGASWLPLSAKQADYTNALAKKYAGRNVVFYFVATDSASAGSKNFASNDDIRKFAFTNKLTMPVLRDSEGAATFRKYDIDQVPSFVILDKNGVRSGEPIGGIDSTGKYDLTVPLSKTIDRLL